MDLPIGPHDLFVAAFDEQLTKDLPNVDPTKLAWEMNRDVVSAARQFVCVDDSQIDFVRTWIGAAPDRGILTQTQRQNILAIGRGGCSLPMSDSPAQWPWAGDLARSTAPCRWLKRKPAG